MIEEGYDFGRGDTPISNDVLGHVDDIQNRIGAYSSTSQALSANSNGNFRSTPSAPTK